VSNGRSAVLWTVAVSGALELSPDGREIYVVITNSQSDIVLQS
jgi:hypothetical protein